MFAKDMLRCDTRQDETTRAPAIPFPAIIWQPPFARRRGILHPRAPSRKCSRRSASFQGHLFFLVLSDEVAAPIDLLSLQYVAVQSSTMEPLEGGSLPPPRKRKRTSANQNQPHTSLQADSSSRRNSSSSSDILVAAPTPSSLQLLPSSSGMDEKSKSTMGPAISTPRMAKAVTARVEDGTTLVVRFNDANSRRAFQEIVRASQTASIADRGLHSLDDDDGPNARGTYSKAYTLKHPEVEWTHRGQGRYIPAAQARGIAHPPSAE